MNNPLDLFSMQDRFNRRTFMKQTGGVGLAALASILSESSSASPLTGHSSPDEEKRFGGLPGVPHFTPKAKRVIYLFQSGAPSQMELFDPKPSLAQRRGED